MIIEPVDENAKSVHVKRRKKKNLTMSFDLLPKRKTERA